MKYLCPICKAHHLSQVGMKFTCPKCKISFPKSTLEKRPVSELVDGPACNCDGVLVLGCPRHDPLPITEPHDVH